MRSSATARYLCLVILLLLQGCIYDRILQSKAQLCKVQPAQIVVETSPTGARSVVFKQPTLTLKDVVWLLGADPSSRVDTASAVHLTYASVPLGGAATARDELVLELVFPKVDGTYKLHRAQIPAQFEQILSFRLIDEAMRAVCRSKIYPASLRAEFDLTNIDKTALPTRAQLLSILNESAIEQGGDSLEYRYCLKPCASNRQRLSHWRMAFDRDGRLEAAAVGYFRYEFTLDMHSGKARIALRSSSAQAKMR